MAIFLRENLVALITTSVERLYPWCTLQTATSLLILARNSLALSLGKT